MFIVQYMSGKVPYMAWGPFDTYALALAFRTRLDQSPVWHNANLHVVPLTPPASVYPSTS
jgi:hypothetical protein